MPFPKDFLWGCASAAFQVEGAHDADGKVPGIWDALTEGHVRHGQNGNTACDHYHRFREDVAIMKQLGLKSYRFSISWPRVMSGPDQVNEKGLQFYSDLVDELISAGIEPLVTLFHWNLPMWAYEQGGWKNQKTVDWFETYTKAVVEKLSDRVSWWMTFNEPQLFIGTGHVDGVHAPFVHDPDHFNDYTRIVMLSHGKAVRAIRALAKKPPKIGMAPTGGCYIPRDASPAAVEDAKYRTYEGEGPNGNIWWADPIVLGKVPAGLEGTLSPADLEIIHQPLDFYGFNIYTANQFWANDNNPHLYDGMPRTGIDWVIAPECLYWAPKFHYERYGLPILITENGMANRDFVMLDGMVHDPQRIDFIHRYLLQLKRAVEEGVPVLGYQHWSIMDNFEWAEGYEQRFGLVYVDYHTKERTIKDSGWYYADVIRSNGEIL